MSYHMTYRESNEDCNEYGADGIRNHPAEQVHQDSYTATTLPHSLINYVSQFYRSSVTLT